MDVVSQAMDQIANLESIRNLPTLVDLLSTLKRRPSVHWLLPLRICQVVGGNEEDAIPAVAATIALHSGIVMIDDLLDHDHRFEGTGMESGDIANYSSAILAAGYSSIFQSRLSMQIKQTIFEHINTCIGMTAIGQYLDTHSVISNEDDYWKVMHLKSAPFFSTAFFIGSLLGTLSQDEAEVFKEIGSLFGEMIQIHDDLRDCFTTPATRDWSLNRYTLPILYAHLVNYPEREIFESIHPEIQDIQKLRQAQTLLLRSGAVSYCIYCLIQRSEKIESLASSLSLPNPKPLQEVLSTVIRPAYQLLEKFQTS